MKKSSVASETSGCAPESSELGKQLVRFSNHDSLAAAGDAVCGSHYVGDVMLCRAAVYLSLHWSSSRAPAFIIIIIMHASRENQVPAGMYRCHQLSPRSRMRAVFVP